MNNLNYPKVYGVNQIHRHSGFDNFGNRYYDLAAYVAMQAYLIKEIKTYDVNGESKMSYEVVFILDNDFNMQQPNYNYYNQLINSTIVNNIYKSMDEAKTIEKELNEDLVIEKSIFESVENIDSVMENHNSDIKKLVKSANLIIKK